METKKLIKINLIIGIIISLFLSIKGAINYGWFSCIGLMVIKECSLFKWILQIIILSIVFTLLLILIEYGAKHLYKSFKEKKPGSVPKKKEEVKEKVEELKEEIKEEKPKKKVIKI